MLSYLEGMAQLNTNYLEELARLDWSKHRMFPENEETERPIRVLATNLNMTSKELDKLALAVHGLVEKYSDYKGKALSTIAKKCWYYLKEKDQENLTHISFFPHLPLFATCNQVYQECYPKTEKTFSITCQDGTAEIPVALFKILKRESPLIASLSPPQINQFNITRKTLSTLLDHLCVPPAVDKLQIKEYLELLTAASLLEIDHLQRLYLGNKRVIIDTKWKEIQQLLKDKIDDLKGIEPQIFEKKKILLDTFQEIIQFILDHRSDYLHPLLTVPLKSFRIGIQHTHNPCVAFGPTMPDTIYMNSIEKLKICCWKITKEELTKLCALKNLRELSFDYCHFSEDALEAFPQFLQLESLHIKNSLKENGEEINLLSENLFQLIGQLSNLKELSIFRGGKIEDEWLQHLSKLPLKTLKINRVHFSGKGLQYLKPENLKHLSLKFCWGFSREGIQQILRFSSLQTFKIYLYQSNNAQEQEKTEQDEVNEALIKILPKLSVSDLDISHNVSKST